MEPMQHMLWRHLGFLNDEDAPLEAVLQEYMAMFTWPLRPNVICALTAFFDINDEATDVLDDAMFEQPGEGITDLQEVVIA